MAKNRKQTTSNQTKPNQTVIQDFGIEIRSIDRTPKDLARWKLALQSAENILMPLRKPLYDLYADIELDEHLTSVMGQRRDALTNASLVFQKDGKPVDEINALINTLAFENLLEYIIDSKFFGFSLIRFDVKGGTPVCELVPRPHVVPEFGLVVATPGDQAGINYLQPPYTFEYLGVGKTNDFGLLLKAAPLVLLKRGNVSDWASFNEVFGQPLRKGTYSPGDPSQKAQLEQAMANMGSMSWVVVPEGSNLEIIGNYQTASADTYSKLTDHFDKAISKLIVGQTMTTESGASLSQSEVHERVAGKQGQADRRFVLKVLNSMLIPMLQAQGVPADGEFQFVEEEEDVSKKDRLAGDIQIHQTVGKLKKEYWAEEYNVEFVDMSDEENTQEEPEAGDEPEAEEAPKEPAKPDKAKSEQKNTSPYSFRQFLKLWDDFFAKAPTRS